MMEELTELDDLDYYDLPEVGESERYELGQCIRNKNPYPGECELMVIEIRPEKDYYVMQQIEPGGLLGWRERLQIKDAHYYYEKV